MLRLKPFGLLTQMEAAEELKVSRQTMTTRLKMGKLPKPIIKNGSLIIWKLKDIEKLK